MPYFQFPTPPPLNFNYSLKNRSATPNYNLNELNQGVIERLKSADHKYIYGFSPMFIKKGLFYNIDLFNKYKINYPTDNMTWDEIAELAHKFPLNKSADKPLYGVSFDDSFGGDPTLYSDRIFELGTFEKLPILNKEGRKMEVNNVSWKRIWDFVNTQFTNGVFKNAANLNSDPFLSGNSAMSLAPNVYVDVLGRNMKNDWGVVSEPVSKRNPDQSYSLQLQEVYSLYTDTSDTSAAWELLKFIQSDEMTSIMSSKYSHLLFTREKYPIRSGNKDLSSFYKLNHAMEAVSEKTTPEYMSAFKGLAEKELKQVIEENKFVDQALNDLNVSGQKALDDIYMQP